MKRKLTEIEKIAHPLAEKGQCAECGKIRTRRNFLHTGICESCLIDQLESLPDWAKAEYQESPRGERRQTQQA